MKRMMLLLLVLGFCHQIQAQEVEYEEEEYTPRLEILTGASLQFANPVNNFRQNLVTNGYGGGAFVLIKLPQRIPIYFGLELSGITYDRAFIRFLTELDGFLIEVEEETAPRIFLGHLSFRIEPPVNHLLQPYFEGIVGFKNLYTRTKLKDLEVAEDPILYNQLEEGDWAFSYGAAVGFRMPIAWDRIYLDFKCAYL